MLVTVRRAHHRCAGMCTPAVLCTRTAVAHRRIFRCCRAHASRWKRQPGRMLHPVGHKSWLHGFWLSDRYWCSLCSVGCTSWKSRAHLMMGPAIPAAGRAGHIGDGAASVYYDRKLLGGRAEVQGGVEVPAEQPAHSARARTHGRLAAPGQGPGLRTSQLPGATHP